MELGQERPPVRSRPSEQQSGAAVSEAGALRRSFLDLFGRPPLTDERARWMGRSRSEMVDWALTTEEFWQNWLDEQLFYFLLLDSFRPTTEGVQTLPAQLADGRIGVRDALHRVCLSSSFDRRNPGPDTFVTVVMEQLLGIEVQRNARELEIGKRIYDGARGTFLGRPGSSQADVVHIAMGDRRAVRHLLSREFERLTRQAPVEDDLQAWSANLEKDPLAMRSILRTWLLSGAYDARLGCRAPQPNRLYVRALYVDLLGRVPDEREAERLRSALDGLADPGPLRSLIARLILDSGRVSLPERTTIHDPGGWIAELFERLLGRSPDDAELVAFQEAFADPACRPTTVLYAIVSHPEYQTW